ncbi:MAG: hypothetical protein WCP85_26030 [Mariniphaga sp.]
MSSGLCTLPNYWIRVLTTSNPILAARQTNILNTTITTGSQYWGTSSRDNNCCFSA